MKIVAILSFLVFASCAHGPGRDPASIRKFLGNHYTIEIYSSDWCYPCKFEKAYLSSIGVKYIVYNAYEDDCVRIARNPQFCSPPHVPVTILTYANGKKYSKECFDSSQPWTLFEDLTPVN